VAQAPGHADDVVASARRRGIGVAATLGAIVLDDARGLDPASDKALRDDLHSAGSGSILVVVAGILGMAGEFRFGQADQTFLSTPSRPDVVWAKALVFAALGAVYGITAALASLGTTWIWLASQSESLPIGREAVWLTIVGAVGSAVIFALLGVALGALSRNQVPAVVATLAWFVVAEPIVKQISDAFARWLPGAAALALRRVPENGLLSMRTGALVLVAWTLAALAAGLARTARADIA
jgi:ABC-2 type transport system permease protein